MPKVDDHFETVSTTDLRKNFKSFVEQAADENVRIAIMRHGKYVAAMIPYADLVTLVSLDEQAVQESDVAGTPMEDESKDIPLKVLLSDMASTQENATSVGSGSPAIVQSTIKTLLERLHKPRETDSNSSNFVEDKDTKLVTTMIPLTREFEAFEVQRNFDYTSFIAGQITARILDSNVAITEAGISESIEQVVSRSVHDTFETSPLSRLWEGSVQK